jgi:hypothetical protein
MRILLDECVPVQLKGILSGHDCKTATECGWGSLQNGRLLAQAEKDFDCFLTSDQNMRYEQNLSSFNIAVIQLSTNNLRRIKTAAPTILRVLEEVEQGKVLSLDIP